MPCRFPAPLCHAYLTDRARTPMGDGMTCAYRLNFLNFMPRTAAGVAG